MQRGDKAHKKKPNVSFRIDEETISLLKGCADADNIALNAVVNRILKEYAHIHIRAKQIDSKLIYGPFLRNIIDKVDTEKLAIIAQERGRDIFKLINENTINPKDSNNFRIIIRDTFCKSANWANYSEEHIGNKMSVFLTHQMGLKWSEILKNFFCWEITQLEDVKLAEVNFVCSENSLVISFPYRP
jgi:hypothetical protein